MTVVLALLSRLWPYLLAAIVIGGGWFWLNTQWCNHACRSAVSAQKAAQAQLQAIQLQSDHERRTFAAIASKAQTDLAAQQLESSKKVAALEERIRRLSAAPALVPSRELAGVLADASAAANGKEPSTAPASDPEPAAPISEQSLGEAWTKAAEAYRSAFDKWQACVNFYEGLRNESAGRVD